MVRLGSGIRMAVGRFSGLDRYRRAASRVRARCRRAIESRESINALYMESNMPSYICSLSRQRMKMVGLSVGGGLTGVVIFKPSRLPSVFKAQGIKGVEGKRPADTRVLAKKSPCASSSGYVVGAFLMLLI